MAKDIFRHPYQELRRITELPLAEVRWLGSGEPLRRLMALMEASDLVQRVAQGSCTPDTRLVVTDVDPASFAEGMRQGSLSRTCVVLDLTEGVRDRLPEPGMCLQATLVADEEGILRSELLSRASIVPEALELVAELLHGLGVELVQRPVDEAPR